MIPDPTKEIKAIRHRLGAEFNFDLDLIVADIQRRENEFGGDYATRPSRKVQQDNGFCDPLSSEQHYSDSSNSASKQS